MTDPHDRDSDPPRLLDSADELERLLVRSARLDETELSQRRQLRRAIAARAGQALSRKNDRIRAAAIGLGLCAAAATAVVARVAREPEPLPRAETVAPRASSAASASATARVAPAPRLESCPEVVVAQGSAPLIDDFEDRNARLVIQDGRTGHWFANGDSKAKQRPRADTTAFPVAIPKGREQSRYGLHFSGAQLAKGAGIEAMFAPRNCYDASSYAGIELWAKGPGRVQVLVAMIDVIERRWGGLCSENCYDSHRVALDLTPEWRRYSFRWEELRQLGYGTPLTFDLKRLWSVQFWVESADTPFDLWIDDVSFLTR
jgi:hypothetical protein